MDKIKTSARRKKFSSNTSSIKNKNEIQLKRGTGIRKSNPTQELQNDQLIGLAIWECLKEGDAEGVIEVILAYLEAANKSKLSKEHSVARSTIYHTLKSKNPTIKTLAKLVHALT
jgi:DNA-binding phage protein